jgi:Icc-related predicted phosphoesterase
MTNCFFVSDLHGEPERYHKLIQKILLEKPDIVFLGGDLLPPTLAKYPSVASREGEFIRRVLFKGFYGVQNTLATAYPRILLILGNDDPLSEEASILEGEENGFWEYISLRCVEVGEYVVYGYANVPPTPFMLKDWERYDVSQYVEPGCISPEEGWRTYPLLDNQIKYSTIERELNELVGDNELSKTIFLFHTPPYQTALDRINPKSKVIDNVPIDMHAGSIAVKRFIEARQPFITLHGHIHESPRLTGSWKELIGRTHAFSAAHDGRELALLRFELENPEKATRELI